MSGAASQSPAAWIALLLPERVDESLRLPTDALLTYQRVRWRDGGPPAEGCELQARAVWSRTTGDTTEVGLRSEATCADIALADALLVVRHAGGRADLGQGRVPDVPAVSGAIKADGFIISERETREFVAAVDGWYPATTNMGDARQRGFANIIVPGPLLLATAFRRELLQRGGCVECWFRETVPAGSMVTRWRAGDDLSELWLPGRSRAAAVCRWAQGH
jgi:hypothetical protein